MGFIEITFYSLILLFLIGFTIYLINYYRNQKIKGPRPVSKWHQFVKKITTKIKDFLVIIPVKKTIFITLGSVLLLVVVLSFLQPQTLNHYIDGSDLSYRYEPTITQSDVVYYSSFKVANSNKQIVNINEAFLVDQYNANIIDGTNEIYSEEYAAYQAFSNTTSDIALLDSDNTISFNVGVLNDGLYHLAIDFYELTSLIDATQIDIRINGQNPYYEAKTIVLPSIWVFETDEFKLDRYFNEIQPQSEKTKGWMHHKINDQKGLHPGLFLFPLKSNDEISIHYVNAELLIGQIYLVSEENIPTYEAYLQGKNLSDVHKAYSEVSARNISRRSDASIRLRPDQDASHMYYDTQFLRLNVVFSDSWQNGGQSLTYQVEAPESGFYTLSVKYRQYALRDMATFRKVYIDGEVPFKDFEAVAFPYTTSFINRTLVDSENNPYFIYLDAGMHEITFESVLYPYRNAIEKIREIMSKIQSLALDVKRYTAGGTDPYRDWDIEIYFPSAQGDIRSWAYELEDLYNELSILSTINNPSEIINLRVAASRLMSIAEEINRLPSRMVQFSDGDSSVNQLLGFLMQRLMTSPLELERTMISYDAALPSPHSNLFVNLWEGTKRLVLSFINNPYSINNGSDDELVVWVNHPRQYIEIMQAMIDQQFNGPYRVTLSQMPNQNKLILANTSGKSPDVALGVDHWIPYDFAIRDASLDLRQFEGYQELVSHFSKGAMIPFIFEDGVFGIPETQNFWVTYYRRDILDSIGITDIPQTWEEIIEILPILQSYGLNYFVPLAQYTGLKPFVATLPFIYQFGGDLYSDNGMSTAINSEETLQGIKLMSDLFTLYNIPKYVASFYNNFRYGTLPIGISDLSTYILLQTAAKELDGLWSMDLHPGYYDQSKDEIVRYSASGAQANMILSATNKKDAAWDFLKWWMSTPVQSEFAFTLQATYGKAYFWNTANLDAFATVSMPKVYRDIVLAQWNYALEAPRIPGTYMVEREISNAWTTIVFDGTNPRQALDNAVRVSNREILYKMAEFGYVVDGVIVKNYPVPNMNNVDYWLEER
ncbi:extracellular solute-binding protein [Acholeplasma equirhinis]|uniref:extracellular solute-binding protein n=1 Tax=Acholeplasma equirhinis TaxID=555393 RepID=UPI00197AAB24|nr:extracellular solute-binding protein [Acholeplasma equirhinis]MBN3490403.1 extracellular solute-binding protein [Acholeplasma equirhinis]